MLCSRSVTWNLLLGTKRRWAAAALLASLVITAPAWTDGPRTKKLIYSGQGDTSLQNRGMPYPALLLEHLQSTFQNRPFDGLSFVPDWTAHEDYFWQVDPNVQYVDPNNPLNDPNILETFGLSNMAALSGQWGRFTDNFLFLNAGYHIFTWDTLDWFSDAQWREHIIPALKVYAHAAQSAGCKGIWLDVESYGKQRPEYDWGTFCHRFYYDNSHDPNFTGVHDPDDPPYFWLNFPYYSPLACREQARQRGRECMDAIQSEFPNARIFMVAALSSELGLDFDAPRPDPNEPNYDPYDPNDPQVKYYKDNAAHPYYLLPAFVAGMLEQADGARIIDGFEGSYYYLLTNDFFRSFWYQQLRDPTSNDAWRLLADPNDPNNTLAQEKWWTHCEVGTDVQPQFVDEHRDAIGLADFLTHNFVNGLALSEQYCWLWSPLGWNHWWDPNDPNMAEPNQAVKTALEAAPGIYSSQALGFDIDVVNNQVVETNDPNVNLTIAYDMDDPSHVFVSATATAYSPYTYPVTRIDLYQNGLLLATLSRTQLIVNQNGLTWTWYGGTWVTLPNGTYEFGARAFEESTEGHPNRNWSNTSRFRKITVNVNHGEGG